MLAKDYRSQLGTAGITRLPAAVDRSAAGAMVDQVWDSLARRGVSREDPSTWPTGFVGGHQSLRKQRIFDAFATHGVASMADALLGAGTWRADQGWGPALVTFRQPGPWILPHNTWHFDLPGRGAPGQLPALRLFGYLSDVRPEGGGTLVVEGTHELVCRMVAESPDHDAGSSSQLRKRLIGKSPWFRALCREGDDRVRQFMTDGDEIDGVPVRVTELTGHAGDVVVMLPWTMHNLGMNCRPTPRLMVTHSLYRIQG